MQLSQSLPRSLAALCLAAIATCSVALAQPAKKYKPQVGQEGKDVVWVPSAQALVDADQVLYGGVHVATICSVTTARGIFAPDC